MSKDSVDLCFSIDESGRLEFTRESIEAINYFYKECLDGSIDIVGDFEDKSFESNLRLTSQDQIKAFKNYVKDSLLNKTKKLDEEIRKRVIEDWEDLTKRLSSSNKV